MENQSLPIDEAGEGIGGNLLHLEMVIFQVDRGQSGAGVTRVADAPLLQRPANDMKASPSTRALPLPAFETFNTHTCRNCAFNWKHCEFVDSKLVQRSVEDVQCVTKEPISIIGDST